MFHVSNGDTDNMTQFTVSLYCQFVAKELKTLMIVAERMLLYLEVKALLNCILITPETLCVRVKDRFSYRLDLISTCRWKLLEGK